MKTLAAGEATGTLTLSYRDELRASSAAIAIAMVILGDMLFFAEVILRNPSRLAAVGAFLIAAGLAGWRLSGAHMAAGRWLLVVSLVGSAMLLYLWVDVPEALALLAIPSLVAASLIGLPAGAGLAACETGLVAALVVFPGSGLGERAASMLLVLIWASLALFYGQHRRVTWLASWSGEYYERARGLLEEARNRQAELKQALKDLADANRQLALANEKLAAARWAAEEAEQTKSAFVANVSHELRTPLNMIVGFSEMITQAPQTYGRSLPQSLLADLTVILRNAQHLSGLIDDVLDLSQIEARRMALTKERVAMCEVVEAARLAVSRLFASKGLALETDVPQELPMVFCDRTRIREVVLNLLSNAVRFTQQGGVRVRAWQEGLDVVVSVADTGPGISPENARRVFRPFEQLDGTIRRRYGGSGLGLSISKGFVELHGGKMWFESQPEQGTTFYFRLPIDAPAPVVGGIARWLSPTWEYQQRAGPSLAPAPDARTRLLVVETGQALQRLLNRYLDGVEVLRAFTLEEALEELARAPALALLINDSAPTEALRRAQAAPTLPRHTPVLACSVPDLSESADALGVCHYLVKPISREQLLGALDRLQLSGKTVLVVDDEPEAQRLFWRMLASAERDYRVLTAADGQEALRILRDDKPDVVLLDLVMPEMDGFRLLEVRNQDPALRQIPVIVTSARDPSGQPITAGALAVTQGGGLAVHQLLACIEAICRILAAGRPQAAPAPQGMPAGQLVS